MFFASGISLLMYLFHEDTIIILGTLMGNLGRIFSINEWRVFLGLALACAAILYWLYRQSTTLDIVSSGDVFAGSVGIDVAALRKRVFVLSSILIGIVVSYAGIIGFVGLVVPHVARFYMGSGQKRVYPFSMFLGAFFLLGCDLLAQHLTVLELPVGSDHRGDRMSLLYVADAERWKVRPERQLLIQSPAAGMISAMRGSL